VNCSSVNYRQFYSLLKPLSPTCSATAICYKGNEVIEI